MGYIKGNINEDFCKQARSRFEEICDKISFQAYLPEDVETRIYRYDEIVKAIKNQDEKACDLVGLCQNRMYFVEVKKTLFYEEKKGSIPGGSLLQACEQIDQSIKREIGDFPGYKDVHIRFACQTNTIGVSLDLIQEHLLYDLRQLFKDRAFIAREPVLTEEIDDWKGS